MTDRSRLNWATSCIYVGGVICIGWVAGSFVALFELAPDEAAPWRQLRAAGPLGLCLVILGSSLCKWDLPALRRKVSEGGVAEGEAAPGPDDRL